jgi:hypothetical protein
MHNLKHRKWALCIGHAGNFGWIWVEPKFGWPLFPIYLIERLSFLGFAMHRGAPKWGQQRKFLESRYFSPVQVVLCNNSSHLNKKLCNSSVKGWKRGRVTSTDRLIRASYRPWAADGYCIRLKPLVSNNEASTDGSTSGSKNMTPTDGLLKEPSPRMETLTTDHRLQYFRRLRMTTVSKTSTFRGGYDERPPQKERRIILATASRNRDGFTLWPSQKVNLEAVNYAARLNFIDGWYCELPQCVLVVEMDFVCGRFKEIYQKRRFSR